MIAVNQDSKTCKVQNRNGKQRNLHMDLLQISMLGFIALFKIAIQKELLVKRCSKYRPNSQIKLSFKGSNVVFPNLRCKVSNGISTSAVGLCQISLVKWHQALDNFFSRLEINLVLFIRARLL